MLSLQEAFTKYFTKDEPSEISLNDTVYNFSADHSSIEKEDILNFNQDLVVKSDVKQYLVLLKQYLLDY